MKSVPLSKGREAIVDDDDYARVSGFRWYATSGTPDTPRYAARKRPARDPGPRVIYLHRELLNAPSGLEVDHINGNTFDNRRCNLRLCSNYGTSRNRRKSAGHSSVHKGVYWHRGARKWAAVIHVNDRARHLGLFSDESHAARVYDAAARTHFGEFARPNFPDSRVAK